MGSLTGRVCRDAPPRPVRDKMADKSINVGHDNLGIINQGDHNTIYQVTNHYHNQHNHSISIPDIYNASIVSIHNADNQIIATGSLVTSNYIITTYTNISNSDTFTVTFALRTPKSSFEATLIEHDEAYNIALLQIDSDTPFSVPLITAHYGEGFVAYGFDTPNGEWIEGEYKGSLANASHQIITQKPIGSGFGGSPIWDIANGGISGVMIDAHSMIPIAKVLESFSIIDDELKAFQNPYKGLFHFDYEDRERFYGREDEIAKITHELKSTKLYTIIGASGSGKSSLLFAGVVPCIKDNDNILHFRPSNQVFYNLSRSLLANESSTITERIKETKVLEQSLITGEIGLDE